MKHGDEDPGSESPEMAELRAEIDAVERGVLRRIDPGAGALVIAVGLLVLAGAAALPWAGGLSGWQVLLGQSVEGMSLIPRIFSFVGLGFGVLLSMIALVTRWWALALVCALGSWLGVVTGVLAIWSQQSSKGHIPGPGPGFGLVLAVITMLVLAIQWFRIAVRRP